MIRIPVRPVVLVVLLLATRLGVPPAGAAAAQSAPTAPTSDATAQELALAEREVEQGRAAARRGELDAASSHHQAALAIRERLAPDTLPHAEALAELGDVERQRGDLDRALELQRRALALREKLEPQGLAHAESLRGMGITLRLKGALDEAEASLRQAMEIEDRLAPQGVEGARTRAALGVLRMVRGDLPQSEALQREALAVFERLLPDSLEIASSWNNLGNVARDGGRLDEAAAAYARALELYERLAPDSIGMGLVLNNLGLLASRRNELDRAEELHRRALAIFERRAPGRLDHGGSLRNLGIVAFRRGDLQGAEQGFAGSLAIEERLAPGSPTMAGSLNNLGLVAATRGDLERAEEHYARALPIVERHSPGSVQHSYLLTNLGLVAQQRGDFERAADLQRQALAVAEKRAPDSRDVFEDLVNLGNTAHAAGELEAAAGYYERALVLARKLSPEGLEVAFSEDNLGILARSRGDLAEARAHHERALALKRANTQDGLVVANSLASLGGVALAMGDLDGAETRFLEARSIEEKLAPGSVRLAKTIHQLATVARRRGQLEAAARGCADAVAVLEQQVGRLGGAEEQRAGFRGRHAEVYRDWVELLLDLGRGPEAFAALERSRARSFLTLLAERDLVLRGDVPPELDQSRRTLAVRYDRAQEELGSLSPTRDGERVTALLAELRALRDELARVRAAIRDAAPRLAELEDPRPVDLGTVRNELAPGTLLLAFSVGEERSDLFAVAAGGELTTYRLEVGAAELRSAVESFRELIAETRTPSPREASLRQVASRLYEQLLAPASSRIAVAERLLVVADGPLQRLPWGALVQPGGAEGGSDYLAAWKPLSTTLSATVHIELARRARERQAAGNPTVSGFGDPVYDATTAAATRTRERVTARGCRLVPLPATRREASEIARLYADGAKLYLAGAATEERAKEALATTGMVHFAVHGCLDERFPLNSGIALSLPGVDEAQVEAAQSPHDNGILQAWEVLEQVRTDAELVVLSACESGLGRETQGEGLLGLTRALQYAGARNVLASLWQVADDATAELMIRFHRELRAGADTESALRAAQLHLLRRDGGGARARDWRLPYYWAGFELFR